MPKQPRTWEPYEAAEAQQCLNAAFNGGKDSVVLAVGDIYGQPLQICFKTFLATNCWGKARALQLVDAASGKEINSHDILCKPK